MWGRGDGLAGEGAKTLNDEGVDRFSVVLAFEIPIGRRRGREKSTGGGRKEGRETRCSIRHGQSQDCWNRRSKDEFDGDAMLGRGIRRACGVLGRGRGRAWLATRCARHRGRGVERYGGGDGADNEA